MKGNTVTGTFVALCAAVLQGVAAENSGSVFIYPNTTTIWQESPQYAVWNTSKISPGFVGDGLLQLHAVGVEDPWVMVPLADQVNVSQGGWPAAIPIDVSTSYKYQIALIIHYPVTIGSVASPAKAPTTTLLSEPFPVDFGKQY
ncbi:hypothetical protein K466DRAFT_594577 [Polyporus arcularius HHB13444]|uniref:Glycoside hydrolase family 61 protein n=1 Tax=Polyporus arcularius HHB13444 TaxID=1314778 RepID=A0A5C3PTZ8_9APHY|nr:hypothetical protein K466DRAFT_594577 [Polyporus arcularius HHB13444]